MGNVINEAVHELFLKILIGRDTLLNVTQFKF